MSGAEGTSATECDSEPDGRIFFRCEGKKVFTGEGAVGQAIISKRRDIPNEWEGGKIPSEVMVKTDPEDLGDTLSFKELTEIDSVKVGAVRQTDRSKRDGLLLRTFRSAVVAWLEVTAFVVASFVIASVAFGPAAVALPALAAEAEDGLWYFDETGIGDIHDAGVTGEGVTIAVIDSPINLAVDDLKGADIQPRTAQLCAEFTGVEASQRARHATAMTSLLLGNGTGIGAEPGVLGVAPDATVLHYAVLNVAVSECDAPLTSFVADAIDQDADILNLSISYDSPRDARDAIQLALDAGLIVNVAVQNETSDELDLLSGLPGVVSIENVDREGGPDEFTVTGPELDFLAPGVDIRMLRTDFLGYELDDGTSPATAWVSGAFALAKSAWPDATGNQLIQSAIRSTNPNGPTAVPAPRTDETGYGQLVPSILVTTDPTQLPDENPLLLSGEVQAQPPEQNPGQAPAPTTAPTSTPAAPASAESQIAFVGISFVIATGFYVVLLLVRRRRYLRDAHRG